MGMGFDSKGNFAPPKVFLGMASPIKTRPSILHSQSLPSGSFHKPLIVILQRADNENHNYRKLIKLITWTRALSNSMKTWAMLCRATQDGWVMVESSDKSWSPRGGKGKPLQYSCLENPMNSTKRQKDMTPKDELPQYATREKWRNNSRNNEEMEPTWKQYPVVDVTCDGSKSNAIKNNIRNLECQVHESK